MGGHLHAQVNRTLPGMAGHTRETDMAELPNCNHEEGYIKDDHGVRVRRVPGHDCAYVNARNALIPEAERVANRDALMEVPEGDASPRYKSVWDRKFHAAMNNLAQQRGLVASLRS